MTDLTIRDLDERIIEALTRRAKANNRSLEVEIREILVQVSIATENFPLLSIENFSL